MNDVSMTSPAAMAARSLSKDVAASPSTVSSMSAAAQWGYRADRATSPGHLTDAECNRLIHGPKAKSKAPTAAQKLAAAEARIRELEAVVRDLEGRLLATAA